MSYFPKLVNWLLPIYLCHHLLSTLRFQVKPRVFYWCLFRDGMRGTLWRRLWISLWEYSSCRRDACWCNSWYRKLCCRLVSKRALILFPGPPLLQAPSLLLVYLSFNWLLLIRLIIQDYFCLGTESSQMVLFHLIVWLTPSHFNWLPRSCSAPSLSRPGVTPREAQYASLPSSPAWRTKAHGVKWNLKYLRRLLRDGLWPYGACQFDPYLLPGSHQEQILQWQPLAWTFSFGAITARGLAPGA